MGERRKWKADEKLAIIKEIEETGKVIETCRKYSISNGMYYDVPLLNLDTFDDMVRLMKFFISLYLHR